MQVLRLDKPADFTAAAMPLLIEHEAENNLIIGLLERMKDPAEAIFCVVRDQRGPIAAALMTDPLHNLLLTHADDGAIEALVDRLASERIVLPGVQGPLPQAERFAAGWTRRHDLVARPRLSLGIYRLTQVIPPAKPAPGELRVAGEEDLALVMQWTAEFCEELGERHPTDPDDHARQRIAGGSIHLWHDAGRAVSMAASAGPTPNGIRIGLVYTPPALRRKGYASTAVAALSQKLLKSGRRFCFLFTDLANPTSNKIYRDIGYKHVCNQLQILFDPAPATQA